MHRILYIQKSKAISIVTTIPCAAGDVMLAATQNVRMMESGAN
jgi:hypothetical protein